MTKPKKIKYPKKPKATSSNEVKENWLKRTKEIDKTNTKRLSDYNAQVKKKKTLTEKIKNTRQK